MMRMKKRSMLVAGMVALVATLGASGMVGVSVVAPADAPVATHSQHSTNVRTGAQGSAPATSPSAADQAWPSAVASAALAPPTTAPAVAPVGPPSDRPAPGGLAGKPGQEVKVAPLPDVASDNAHPGNDKPQSLSEALARPHGVAAAGVTPEVNDAARTGGCAPGYGDGRSCLPVAPPSAAQQAGHNVEVKWTCKELLTLLPKGIPLQIPGVDPLGLDEDGNGIACA